MARFSRRLFAHRGGALTLAAVTLPLFAYHAQKFPEKLVVPLPQSQAILPLAQCTGPVSARTCGALSSERCHAFTKLQVVVRMAELGLWLTPLVLCFPLYWLSLNIEHLSSLQAWYERLTFLILQANGPVWIKLGQWVSSRPDLFPSGLVNRLESLQHAVQSVGRPDGDKVEALLQRSYPNLIPNDSISCIDHLGSGSIADVFKISTRDGRHYAFKVLRQGIASKIALDLLIIRAVLYILPKSVPLSQHMAWVDSLLTSQTNLENERQNIERFARNFERSQSIHFPKTFAPTDCSTEVLLESFEDGLLLSDFLKLFVSEDLRKAIALQGTKAYMQMVLKDNFVHADLHPGNVIVRLKPKRSLFRTVLPAYSKEEISSVTAEGTHVPELVILDSGLAVGNLSNSDFVTLKSIVKAIVMFDGANLGRILLANCSKPMEVWDPNGLIQTLDAFFTEFERKVWFENQGSYPTFKDFNDHSLLKSAINLFSKHNVSMPIQFYSLMVSSMLAEGLARSLNDSTDIYTFALEAL